VKHDLRTDVAAADQPDGHVATVVPASRARFSPLTRRILTVNIFALAVLVAGLLYLGQYRDNLIGSRIQALHTQGKIFAGALGQGAFGTAPDGTTVLKPLLAAPMLRRLALPTRSRARLFAADGDLLADSRVLLGPGGAVEVAVLPPPEAAGTLVSFVLDIYEGTVDWLTGSRSLPRYRERAIQRVGDYDEVMTALAGEEAHRVRIDDAGDMVLSVAVPVQRFKQVRGALLLTASGREIERAVRAVQVDILEVFLVALAVTVLLSVYLAGTIVRPIRRLADAAERVRGARRREHVIPDFQSRGDEIGDLSGALRDMTDALWQRLDAIESFAADVAHEIKNPLTSLRSAVETAARVEDAEQQRRLMSIILEDVERLDRLITDISNVSRLDAELSRVETTRIDLGRLLAALVEMHRTADVAGLPEIALQAPDDGRLMVDGNEGRLVQLFQNLLSNAFSFSPEGGSVLLSARLADNIIEVTVDDDGPGIPEGSFEAVFDRFYSDRPEGEQFGTHSGLGLNISRQIVEALGGTIVAGNRRARSGAVAGARFTVRLPVVQS
jgi:two-component system sensor histidine kinase ChvG